MDGFKTSNRHIAEHGVETLNILANRTGKRHFFLNPDGTVSSYKTAEEQRNSQREYLN
jgi:hypothetical protein